MLEASLFPLRDLLIKREQVIADHAWRDRDPEAHLEAIKNVSLAIEAWHQLHATELNSQLQHYLQNASYQKALAWIDSGGTLRHRP